MKKVLFLTLSLVAMSWACGGESTNTVPGDSTAAADSVPANTDTLPAQDSLNADTMGQSADPKAGDPNASNDRKASWAAKDKGVVVGNFDENFQLDVVLPDDVMKITVFRDYVKDGYRITNSWLETPAEGVYYLLGTASMGEKSMTVAKKLTVSGKQLILPDKGLLVNICEGQGCKVCTMNWDAKGNFKDCNCGQDSRRTCAHRAEKK